MPVAMGDNMALLGNVTAVGVGVCVTFVRHGR